MKRLLLILLILCFGCKKSNIEKHIVNTNDSISTNTFLDSITKQELPVGLIQIIDDSISQISLGSKFLIYNFPKGGVNNKISSKNKHYNYLLDSIYITYERIDNLKTSNCYKSNEGILHEYFESDELVDDSNTEYFEYLTKLPKIHDFEISIEKVTKKCNNANSLETQYCLVLSKNKKVIRRYNIGYIDYGDLSTSSKYWFISKDYIVHTRIFGEVAEEDEEFSSTFISKVNSYIITKSGHLVSYFNKNGIYKTETEEGLVNDHLKHGEWIEKKSNYGYVNNETYAIGNYTNGLKTGMWNYFELETIEVVNDDGYITNTHTKKGSRLLMTEEYSDNGELLKREILDNN